MAELWSIEEELLNERSPFQVFKRPTDPFARLPGDESDLDTITGHVPEGISRHPALPREGKKSLPSRMLEWMSGLIPHGEPLAGKRVGDAITETLPEAAQPYFPKGLLNMGLTDIPRGMTDSTAWWADWQNKGLGEADPMAVLMNPVTTATILGGRPLQRAMGRDGAVLPDMSTLEPQGLYSRADKRAAKFATLTEAERRARQEASARQQVEADFKKVVEGIPGVRIAPNRETGNGAIRSRTSDSAYYQLRPEGRFQQAVTVRQGDHPGRPITGRQRTQVDREFHAPNIMVDLSRPLPEGPTPWQETAGGIPYLKGDKLDMKTLEKTLSNLFMKGDWLVSPEYRARGIIPEQPPKHTTSPRAGEYDPFKDTHRNPRLSSTVGELWAKGDKKAIAATVDQRKFETPREKAEKAYDAGPYEVPVNELSPLEGTPYSADLKYPPLPKKTEGTGKVTDYLIDPTSQALKFDQAWLDPRNTDRPILPDDARAQGRPELLQQAMEKFYAEPNYKGGGGAEALAKRKHDPVDSMNYWQAQQRFRGDDPGTLHAKGGNRWAAMLDSIDPAKRDAVAATLKKLEGVSPQGVAKVLEQQHGVKIDPFQVQAPAAAPKAAPDYRTDPKFANSERWAHKRQLTPPAQSPRPSDRARPWSRNPELVNSVREMIDKQMTRGEIQQATGLTAGQVAGFRHRYREQTPLPDSVRQEMLSERAKKAAAGRWGSAAEREAASQQAGVEAEMAKRPGGLKRELYDPEKGPAEWGVETDLYTRGPRGKKDDTLYAGGNKMPFRRFGYDPERKAEGPHGKLSDEQKAAAERRKASGKEAQREQHSQEMRVREEGGKYDPELDVSRSRKGREVLDREFVEKILGRDTKDIELGANKRRSLMPATPGDVDWKAVGLPANKRPPKTHPQYPDLQAARKAWDAGIRDEAQLREIAFRRSESPRTGEWFNADLGIDYKGRRRVPIGQQSEGWKNLMKWLETGKMFD